LFSLWQLEPTIWLLKWSQLYRPRVRHSLSDCPTTSPLGLGSPVPWPTYWFSPAMQQRKATALAGGVCLAAAPVGMAMQYTLFSSWGFGGLAGYGFHGCGNVETCTIMMLGLPQCRSCLKESPPMLTTSLRSSLSEVWVSLTHLCKSWSGWLQEQGLATILQIWAKPSFRHRTADLTQVQIEFSPRDYGRET